jgi:hypothetical protein
MNMTYSIRKSLLTDIDEIMQIYTHARAEMAKSNPTQWGDNHPSREMIVADVAAGKSYVCVSDTGDSGTAYTAKRIAAVFYFAVEDDPTYAVIDGEWLDGSAPYGVVHRIARAAWAKGAGAFCMEWCFGECANIRVDTHPDNAPMLKILDRLGYSRCGIIRLGLFEEAEMDERVAFQKIENRKL